MDVEVLRKTGITLRELSTLAKNFNLSIDGSLVEDKLGENISDNLNVVNKNATVDVNEDVACKKFAYLKAAMERLCCHQNNLLSICGLYVSAELLVIHLSCVSLDCAAFFLGTVPSSGKIS